MNEPEETAEKQNLAELKNRFLSALPSAIDLLGERHADGFTVAQLREYLDQHHQISLSFASSQRTTYWLNQEIAAGHLQREKKEGESVYCYLRIMQGESAEKLAKEPPSESRKLPHYQRGGKTNGGYTTIGEALKDAGIGAGGSQPDTEPEKERAMTEETDEERRRRSGIASHTAVYYYRLRELAPEVAPNLDEFRRGNERIDQKFFLRFSNEDLERFNALFKKLCNEHPLAREIPKGMASRCLKMLEPINKEKLSGEQREFLDELTKVEDEQEHLRLIRRKPFPFVQDLLNVCDRESRERKLGEFFAAHEQEKLPGAIVELSEQPLKEEAVVADTEETQENEESKENLDVGSAAEVEATTDATRKAETIHPGLDATMRGLPPAALANLDDVLQQHKEEQIKASSTAPNAQAEGGEDVVIIQVESAETLAAKNAALEEELRTLGEERDSCQAALEAARAVTKTVPEVQPAADVYPLLTSLCQRLSISPQVLTQRFEELLKTAGSLQELQDKLARHEQLQSVVVELRKRAVPDWMITSLGLEVASITQEQLDQRLERLVTLFKKRSEEVAKLTAQLQQKGESMTKSSDEQSRAEIASRAAVPSRAARAGAWCRQNGQRVAVAVVMIALVSLLMWVIIKDSHLSPNQTSSAPATGQQATPPAGAVPTKPDGAPGTAVASDGSVKPQSSEFEKWWGDYERQRQTLKQKYSTP